MQKYIFYKYTYRYDAEALAERPLSNYVSTYGNYDAINSSWLTRVATFETEIEYNNDWAPTVDSLGPQSQNFKFTNIHQNTYGLTVVADSLPTMAWIGAPEPPPAALNGEETNRQIIEDYMDDVYLSFLALRGTNGVSDSELMNQSYGLMTFQFQDVESEWNPSYTQAWLEGYGDANQVYGFEVDVVDTTKQLVTQITESCISIFNDNWSHIIILPAKTVAITM